MQQSETHIWGTTMVRGRYEIQNKMMARNETQEFDPLGSLNIIQSGNCACEELLPWRNYDVNSV